MTHPFPFAAVIFDMDGVLIDSEAVYARELVRFSDDFGLGLTSKDTYAEVGASYQRFLANLVKWFGAAGRTITEEEGFSLYQGWLDAQPPLDYRAIMNPGVPETLAALREAGVHVALASSSPRANIERAMGECGIADAFEVVVSGEEFTESKPNPQIYLHTVERLGLPVEACCCVEDSVPGITAGVRAGLHVVAKREERFGFSQEGAHEFIDQIPDVLGIRGRLG